MDWRLSLSDYPRTILEDELPLTILAMLERSGLATEHELARKTEIKLSKLRKILVDLKLNRLLEHGKYCIRLTEKGKYLINRFDLQELIIEDLLNTLKFKGKQREDYKIVLLEYRDRTFLSYLNTFCLIRVWKELASKTFLEKKCLYRFNEKEKYAIMQGILIHDLSAWTGDAQLLSNIETEDTNSTLVHTDDIPIFGRLKIGDLIYGTFHDQGIFDFSNKKQKHDSGKEPKELIMDLGRTLYNVHLDLDSIQWYDGVCEIKDELHFDKMKSFPLAIFIKKFGGIIKKKENK